LNERPSDDRHAARSERSTEALITAAAELASEGGLTAMTFAAIGERAGYSRGLVTARFGSKAGLVDAMIRRAWQRLRIFEVLDESHGKPGLTQVIDLLEAFREQAERDPVTMRALAVLLLEAAVGVDEALHQRVLAFHQAMVDELTRVLARGANDTSVRSDLDPRAEAMHIVSALLGQTYLWVLDPEYFRDNQVLALIRERLEPRIQ
jgi:AcrR family transcriptional regulator